MKISKEITIAIMGLEKLLVGQKYKSVTYIIKLGRIFIARAISNIGNNTFPFLRPSIAKRMNTKEKNAKKFPLCIKNMKGYDMKMSIANK